MNKILLIFKKWYIFVGTILLLNLSYVFIYKGRLVAIFVAAAMSSFLVLLMLAGRLETKYDGLPWQGINTKTDTLRLFLLILPFFIPIIFYQFHSRVIFWDFNAIARVSLAWFIFSNLWINLKKEKNNELGFNGVLAPFILFAIWAAILWLSLIWDVGSRILFLKAVSSEALVKTDRLASVIYKIWETKPFSEHFGLAFLDYGTFKQSAFTHHNQLFLFITYLVVKFLQFLINCKMEFATRLLPFFYSTILIITVVFLFLKAKINIQIRKASTQLTFFLGLGFLLSLPDLWITLLRYNTDNPTPWASYMTLMLFAYMLVNDYVSKGFVFVLCFYCLLSPFYALVSLFIFYFFVAIPKILKKNKLSFYKMTIMIGIGLVLITISLVYPHIIAKMLKYKDAGSSLLFRSGLDGDVSYYNNIWQAFIHPYAKSLIRPWSSLIPAVVFCILAFLLGGVKRYKKGSEELKDSIFLFSPYLFLIVFFPQAVSIHPYTYDYLLVFPLVSLGVFWLCSQEFQEKVEGLWLWIFFLFMMSFVIYNLTKIAQAAKNLSF